MSKGHWTENYISTDPDTGEFIAWDESNANEIGRAKTKAGAVSIQLNYAETLKDQMECEHVWSFPVGAEYALCTKCDYSVHKSMVREND